MPLRINAGGYHADSRTGCNLISSVSIIVCFYFISNVFWKEVPSFFACLLFWSIIYKMSPVQNKRKELDAKEKRVYKRRSRIIVSIEGLILTAAFVFQWNTLIKIITSVFLLCHCHWLQAILKIGYGDLFGRYIGERGEDVEQYRLLQTYS